MKITHAAFGYENVEKVVLLRTQQDGTGDAEMDIVGNPVPVYTIQ